MKHFSFFSGIKLAAKAASLALIAGIFSTPASAGIFDGEYTIQQQSTGRYLDAYENASYDFKVGAWPRQNNDTQVWIITPSGRNTYTIRQKSNGRYLDGYYNGTNGFAVMTRPNESNDTQLWRLIQTTGGRYMIQQKMKGAVVHADDAPGGTDAVLKAMLNSPQQQWIIKPATSGSGPVIPPVVIPPVVVVPPLVVVPLQLSGTYYIRQRSNMRFMDAHEGTRDNSVVTRPFQNNATQRWIINPQGNDVYTIRQRSSMMFMDAHEGINDNDVVTRNAQNNTTQQWIIKRVGNNIYTVQQRSNGRYLDAHEAANNDFRVVTRNRQNNTTQQWIITLVP